MYLAKVFCLHVCLYKYLLREQLSLSDPGTGSEVFRASEDLSQTNNGQRQLIVLKLRYSRHQKINLSPQCEMPLSEIYFCDVNCHRSVKLTLIAGDR